jgi:hypothetical protein
MEYIEKLNFLKNAFEKNKKVSFRLTNGIFAEKKVSVLYVNTDDVENADFKIKHKEYIYTYSLNNITFL